MIPLDTSPAAHERQIRFYRSLSPAARIELALRLSEDARRLSRDGIGARHPDYSESDLHFAFLRHWVGDALFRKAWPDAPILDP